MIHKMRIFLFLFFLQHFFSGNAEEKQFYLFSNEMKTEYPSFLYDFLERYLYQLDSLQNANPTQFVNRLGQDKVLFKKGGPQTAKKITPDNPVSIRMIENKYYEVVWLDKAEKEILHMVFPISFELILGTPKNKIETTLRQQLQAMPKTFTPEKQENLAVTEEENGIYIPKDNKYSEIKELNTKTYYLKTKTGKLTPIFDSKQLHFSTVNLFQGIIDQCNEYKLNIFQNLYDFQHEEYTITLGQWLNYCKDIHATIYMGLEEEREDGVKILLLVHSHDLGFHHMMSLIMPWKFVDKPNTVLKAKLNAYIPSHNIMTLYEENQSSRSNKKQ